MKLWVFTLNRMIVGLKSNFHLTRVSGQPATDLEMLSDLKSDTRQHPSHLHVAVFQINVGVIEEIVIEYVITILLLIIVWAVTRPMRKEKEERKAKRLLELMTDYHLHPKPPYDGSNFPLSQREIKWMVKRGKLPPVFLAQIDAKPP